MFESLFAQRSAIARYRSAPLLKERLRYLAHCEQIGIKPATLRKIAFHQLIFVRDLDLQDDDVDLILCKIEAWYRRGPCWRNAHHDLARVDRTSAMPTDGCAFWAGVVAQKPHVMPIHVRSQPSQRMCRANADGLMPRSKAAAERSIAPSSGWTRRVSI
jgi:hypothetical protein